MKSIIDHWNHEHWWLVVGFGGQILFFMRFFVQWIVSEKKKESVIPEAFWFFSFFGGATLLTYAFYKQDPVFIFGQATGLFIYTRNIYLIYNKKKSATEV